MSKLAWSEDGFAIIAALIWGFNYPLVKLVLQSISESQFLLIRFTVSTLLLVSYLLISGEGIGIKKIHYIRVVSLGLLGVGFYNILWTWGIHLTTAANAALLISTSPLFTEIYSVATKQEKVSLQIWIGSMMAFGGIFLIISQTPGSAFSSSSSVFAGNMLVLSSSLLFSFYAIVSKPLLDHYPPIKLTTLAMLYGMPIILFYNLYEDPGMTLSVISSQTWLAMCFIIVLGTITAYVFWYKGIKKTGPVKTTIFHYIVPVTSMILGSIFLGEPITPGQLLGAILVFLGLIVVKTFPEPKVFEMKK